MYALRERRQYVGQEDFEMAIAKVSHAAEADSAVCYRARLKRFYSCV